MAKNTAKRQTANTQESDGVYLFKIALYVILGALWLRFPAPITLGDISIQAFPLGFFIGLVFAGHDHFQVDRKIEYVVLIMATILSVFLPTGIIL